MATEYEIALHEFRAGRLEEAARRCRRMASAHPADPSVLNLTAAVAHGRGDHLLAVRALRRAVRLLPLDSLMRNNLVAACQAAGQAEMAAGILKTLLAFDPGAAALQSRLAAVLQEVGDLDAALAWVRRALRLVPDSGQEAWNIAVVAVTAGQPDIAAPAFRRHLVSDPGGAEGWLQFGAMRLVDGAPDAAVPLFLRAARIRPDLADAENGLRRCRRYRAATIAARRPDAAPGFLIRGPVHGVSGYAHMINRFVATMERRGVPLNLAGLFGGEEWASPPDLAVRNRAAVNFLIPPAVEPIPGLPTVTFSMFEGTRISDAWKRYCDRHDLIIVPADSSKAAWVAAGYPEDRIRICPLGVDPETADGPSLNILDSGGRPVLERRHRILNVSDFIPRKNVDGVLRVWLRSTSARDDAVLILKLGKGKVETRREIPRLIARTEEAVGRRMAEAAPIAIIDQVLSEEQMSGLFRTATHYWSLSHGEGWDLPMSRAGAMGRRLIAPAHSAYLEYLDPTVAHMIPATVGPAHKPYSREPWAPFFGVGWWEPDEDAAGSILSRVVRGEDHARQDVRSRLLERFTWSQATDRLLEILGEVGGKPGG